MKVVKAVLGEGENTDILQTSLRVLAGICKITKRIDTET